MSKVIGRNGLILVVSVKRIFKKKKKLLRLFFYDVCAKQQLTLAEIAVILF